MLTPALTLTLTLTIMSIWPTETIIMYNQDLILILYNKVEQDEK